MREQQSAIPSVLARLARSQRGVAAVEFALLVPVLLLAYLGATDLTQGLAVDRKLGQLAGMVSEQIARESAVSEADVQAVMRTGEAIMRPFDFGRTKLRLTIVKVNGRSAEVTAATERNWTLEAERGDSYVLSDDLLVLADGHHVVIATAAYEFRPSFGVVGVMNLEQHSVHLVRQQVEGFGFASAPR